MPNGHGQRAEDETKLIEAVEQDGWELYESPSDWILDAAESDGIPRATTGFNAAKQTYHGDNYVYLVVSSVHGNSVHVFSQKKSEYFETTPDEETCPNCQEYVRRLDGDDVLTCHRCGWQYDEADAGSLTDRLSDLL